MERRINLYKTIKFTLFSSRVQISRACMWLCLMQDTTEIQPSHFTVQSPIIINTNVAVINGACQIRLSWHFFISTISIKTTMIRRVSRGVNSHVELDPVGLVEGGASQGGRDHCHRVRSAGYLDDNGFLRTAPPPWSWVRHLCFPFGLGCYCTFIHWSEIVRCSSQQTWQRLKSSIAHMTHTPGVVTPSTRP